VVEDVDPLGAETFAEWELGVLIVAAGYQEPAVSQDECPLQNRLVFVFA
jgi:hypothetical protein